jgi:hypothetical protein
MVSSLEDIGDKILGAENGDVVHQGLHEAPASQAGSNASKGPPDRQAKEDGAQDIALAYTLGGGDAGVGAGGGGIPVIVEPANPAVEHVEYGEKGGREGIIKERLADRSTRHGVEGVTDIELKDADARVQLHRHPNEGGDLLAAPRIQEAPLNVAKGLAQVGRDRPKEGEGREAHNNRADAEGAKAKTLAALPSPLTLLEGQLVQGDKRRRCKEVCSNSGDGT